MDLNIILIALGSGIIVGSLVMAAVSKAGAYSERQVLTSGTFGDNRESANAGLEQAVSDLGQKLSTLLPVAGLAQSELDISLRLSGSSKTAAQVWAEQLAAGMVLGGASVLIGTFMGYGRFGLALLLAGGAVGFMIPRALVLYQRSRWHRSISNELPDVLDILCVAVNSGSTLEDGMRIVGETMDGELGKVCARIVVQAGQEGVIAAFRDFADTTGLSDLRNVAFAIWHASESGAPIAAVLAAQADSMRVARRQAVEERSEHIDNLMTIDIGLLIMPAVFAGALAPFIYYIASEFLGSGMV